MKQFLKTLSSHGFLSTVTENLSCDQDISAVLSQFQDRSLLFENAGDSKFRVAGNLYGTRKNLSLGLGLNDDASLVEAISEALDHPSTKMQKIHDFAHLAFDKSEPADFSKLPILKHYSKEAGRYLTAGVVAAKFPGSSEENLSVHRMLVLSKNKVAARIVPRHLNQIAKDVGGKIPVSIIIGPTPSVFLSASLQTRYDLSEYRIASVLSNGELELARSELSDIAVPVDSEFVLEGSLDYSEQVKEGPFVDLTGTYDEVRMQPVITLKRMHYRKDSVYQTILAGSREHALFMGLPQELKIRETLSKSISKVRGINLTPASKGYFHCVVSIVKSNDGDGKTAILDCFAGSHPLKLVIVVDDDIDPFDLEQVEWALVTRFQADKGTVIINGAKGSSLDPSSGKLAVTSKLGLDATLPVKAERSQFEKAEIKLSDKAMGVIKELGNLGTKRSVK